MAKILELQREADAKLLEVLTDEQRKQFEAMQGKKITIELFSILGVFDSCPVQVHLSACGR